MNVYEKLNLARIKFHAMGIKKSGKNKYAGYTYFELDDILPAINSICAEIKATCVVSFGNDYASLIFANAEKPDENIVFTCPMSKADLKGCHEVQNLGAVVSYIKRYLYQNCFEIAESDGLDSTINPNDGKKVEAEKPKPAPVKTKAEESKKAQGWTKAQLDELKSVLDSKLEDGTPVFTEDDKNEFRAKYKEGVKYEDVKRLVLDKQAKAVKAAYAEPPKDDFDIF